jgi:hypothetical protein
LSANFVLEYFYCRAYFVLDYPYWLHILYWNISTDGPILYWNILTDRVRCTAKTQGKMAPGAEQMLCWGWDSVALGGHLTCQDLDQVSALRPVCVWDCSMHFVYANTFAMDKLNLRATAIGHIDGVECDERGPFLPSSIPSLIPSFLNAFLPQCLP